MNAITFLRSFGNFYRACIASVNNNLEVATGINHCMNAEREMEIERIICKTWLTEEPKGIYAFARISGKTYFRPGYFDITKDDWIIPDTYKGNHPWSKSHPEYLEHWKDWLTRIGNGSMIGASRRYKLGCCLEHKDKKKRCNYCVEFSDRRSAI